MKFFTESVESLREMAAPKLPAGVKKKRDDTWGSTHHIEIDGKHVATVVGHKPDRMTRYETGQYKGYSTEHGKHYTIYKSKPSYTAEHGMNSPETIHPDHHATVEKKEYGNGWNHPATGTKHVKVPHVHGSMEAAIDAIHTAHSLKTRFGHMSQTQRWDKAAEMNSHGSVHKKTNAEYVHAKGLLTSLGHHDLADKLQAHHDAHIASKPAVNHHDISALTHDLDHAADNPHHEHHEKAKTIRKQIRGW